MYSRKTGFTLVEVIIASVIGAFVALVAVGTLKAISSSAEIADDNIETAAEVRFASKRIATDLVNLYRNKNLRNAKFIGTAGKSEQMSCLTFYTVGRIQARIDQPEGDVYEVEYYLLKDDEKSVLMRRLWPNPDEDTKPGGILTVIAEGIDVFQVRFFDGTEWQNEWPEDMESVPDLVEVNIAAKQPGRRDVIMESFVVNFVRSQGTPAVTSESGEEEESEEK